MKEVMLIKYYGETLGSDDYNDVTIYLVKEFSHFEKINDEDFETLRQWSYRKHADGVKYLIVEKGVIPVTIAIDEQVKYIAAEKEKARLAEENRLRISREKTEKALLRKKAKTAQEERQLYEVLSKKFNP